MLDHLPRSAYPGQALAIALYLEGGIRTVEIGSVMFGRRDPETGAESYAGHELVRLAVPRRVYTKSHIDYVVETALAVHARRAVIDGVRIVEQPRTLRHFSAVFEPVPAAAAASIAAPAAAPAGRFTGV
jgi:tryptophanase